MYRKYKKAQGERLLPNKLIQVLENNSVGVVDSPRIEKGITLKKPIANSFATGKHQLYKIDGNKVVTIVGNMLHISKYENGNLDEIKSIELEKFKRNMEYYSKITRLNDNKVAIAFSEGFPNNGSISCFTFELNEEKGIEALSKKFVVTSKTGNQNVLDVEALHEKKFIVTYTLSYIPVRGVRSEKDTPMFAVVNINENNEMFMFNEPIEFPNFFPEKKYIGAGKSFVTKLSENEFLSTFTIGHDKTGDVYSTVFRVDSKDIIHEHEQLMYNGIYDNYVLRTTKPIYLQDNRVLTLEAKDHRFHAHIREIKQDNGVYSFNSLTSLEITSYDHKFTSVYLLRENEDKTRDFVVSNQNIIKVNADVDTLTLLDHFKLYNTKTTNMYRDNYFSTIRLENNLMLTLDDNNDYQLIKYDEYESDFLGFAKPQTLTGMDSNLNSVVITGLYKNIEGVNFTAGQSVYYDTLGNLSHDSTGTYLGYAVSNDAMIVRPNFMQNPTIARKFDAEVPINDKVVQVDATTKLVSPLPMKAQGISVNTISNTLPSTHNDKNYIKMKDNVILSVSFNPTTYQGYLQLFQYNSDDTITQIGSNKLFFKNQLYDIRRVKKLADNRAIVIFNDSDGTNGLTYAMGVEIDYSTNTFTTSPFVQLQDFLNADNENSYLYPLSDTKALHVYNFNVYSGSGYTKAQIIEYNPLSNIVTLTTPILLQNDVNSTYRGSLMKMGENYILFYNGKKVGAGDIETVMAAYFTVDESDVITKITESYSPISVANISCKPIDNSHFLMMYNTYDTSYKVNLRIVTINPDYSITLGAEYVNIKGQYQFFDDSLVSDSVYFDDTGILYHLKYTYDIASDTITYLKSQCVGQIRYESSISKINRIKHICITDGTVKQIKNTITNIGGLYHNGQIYFSGYVPYINDTIQNGVLYYWSGDGSITTTATNNVLLGMGLGKGLYIFEKDEKMPVSLEYIMSVSSSPINEIKLGMTKTYTMTKKDNGVVVPSTFNYSIDYMGNATAIVTITGSTANTITLKATSTSTYINKTFTLKCTDTSNGQATEQLIRVKSLI